MLSPKAALCRSMVQRCTDTEGGGFVMLWRTRGLCALAAGGGLLLSLLLHGHLLILAAGLALIWLGRSWIKRS